MRFGSWLWPFGYSQSFFNRRLIATRSPLASPVEAELPHPAEVVLARRSRPSASRFAPGRCRPRRRPGTAGRTAGGPSTPPGGYPSSRSAPAPFPPRPPPPRPPPPRPPSPRPPSPRPPPPRPPPPRPPPPRPPPPRPPCRRPAWAAEMALSREGRNGSGQGAATRSYGDAISACRLAWRDIFRYGV